MRQAKNSSIYEEIGSEDSKYSWYSRTLFGIDQPWSLFSFYHISTKSRTAPSKFGRNTKFGSQKMWQMTAQLSSETLKTWGRIEGKLVIKDKIIHHHNKNFHCGLGQSKLCHGSIEKSRQCIWNANKRKRTALWEFSGWICLYFLTNSGQFSGYKHLFTREELHCIL